MSPRFSGQQYPGAMKDHRARKREEAEALQASSRLLTLRNMQKVSAEMSAGAGIFQPLVDAFRAIGKAWSDSMRTTQKDYTLVADAGRTE